MEHIKFNITKKPCLQLSESEFSKYKIIADRLYIENYVIKKFPLFYLYIERNSLSQEIPNVIVTDENNVYRVSDDFDRDKIIADLIYTDKEDSYVIAIEYDYLDKMSKFIGKQILHKKFILLEIHYNPYTKW